MIKYAVKYLKNVLVPLSFKDNIDPNSLELDDKLVLVRTEKGEEVLKAFRVCPKVAEQYEKTSKAPEAFEFIRIMTQEDMMIYEEVGVIWNRILANKENMVSPFEDLRIWIYSQLAWDSTLVVDDLVNEFMEHYYGAGQAEMRQYYDAWSARHMVVEDMMGGKYYHQYIYSAQMKRQISVSELAICGYHHIFKHFLNIFCLF